MQVVSFLPSFKEALAPRSVTFAEESSDTWCSVLPETWLSSSSCQCCFTALMDLVFPQVKREHSFLVVQLLVSETSRLQSLLQCSVSVGHCYRVFGV